MTTAINLLDFDLEGLVAWCGQLGEKRFRATQLFRWIHQKGVSDFAQMSDLAKSLREKLAGVAVVEPLPVVSQHMSADGTIKWLFDVGDGNAVETVFIPETDRGTLCVSSQAGCAVGCRFCSTGHQGFRLQYQRFLHIQAESIAQIGYFARLYVFLQFRIINQCRAANSGNGLNFIQ